MGSLSGNIKRGLLDHIFNSADLESVPGVYVSAHVRDPGPNGAGGGEPDGGGYRRVRTRPTDWTAASGSSPAKLTNSRPLPFPAATGPWGVVTHFGLWTSESGKSESAFIGSSNMGTQRTVDTGETLVFAEGTLIATVD